MLHLSPPKVKRVLKSIKTPPSQGSHKVRVMFEPFSMMYEYQHFQSKNEEELIKDLIPLLEGARIFLTGRGREERNEKMIRLTPDLKKVEIRQIGTGNQLFKVDSHFWTKDLTGA